jgi:predicted transglutaminase-like cysteine proteinase
LGWGRKRWAAAGGIALELLVCSGATAQQLAALPPEASPSVSPFMDGVGLVPAPSAFLQFCGAQPQECVADPKPRVMAEPAHLLELDQVNREVNHAIVPLSDLKHYGVTDYWTLPMDGKGDCEDYALLKRHNLIKLGWPASALLMTVVRDQKQEGHAVLTARTTEGDFVLDNKSDSIRLWNETHYRFVMRQSFVDPLTWVDLDPADDNATVPVAGIQHR